MGKKYIKINHPRDLPPPLRAIPSIPGFARLWTVGAAWMRGKLAVKGALKTRNGVDVAKGARATMLQRVTGRRLLSDGWGSPGGPFSLFSLFVSFLSFKTFFVKQLLATGGGGGSFFGFFVFLDLFWPTGSENLEAIVWSIIPPFIGHFGTHEPRKR